MYGTMCSNITVVQGYRAGLLADIVAAHIAYYSPAWRFGLQFETKVASELAEFLQRYDASRNLLLSAYDGEGVFLGSITIDGIAAHSEKGAHLRWFITSATARGSGIGRQLLGKAIEFCDANDYEKIYLTTFPGLDAARHLYEQTGFRLFSQTTSDDWNGSVGEQLFERYQPKM
jgi:GNAT superfamily N-acetyltransferase